MLKLLYCVAALFFVTACLAESPNWYEDRCLRLGFERGSAVFNECVERDLQWINENKQRAGEVGP
ncbi:MAG: hypothetical protein ISR50_16355 [Alphaproteobacteria bacterium]|nr:hypothetical protein [Alphaproteobacteria bacterium]